MNQTKLDFAAHALICAKEAETESRNLRIEIEEKIIDWIGVAEEGTITEKTEWYKVSTVGKLTRTIIPERLADLLSTNPDLVAMAIENKSILNIGALKKIATSDPDAYKTICRAISTKPAKTTVKVELLEKKDKG